LTLLFAARVVETITWVRVEKPVLDLVGIVLGSLGLAGLLAAGASVLGLLLGCLLIRRGERLEAPPYDAVSLHLGAVAPLDAAPPGA
jgi:hypothetical protein